MLLIWDAIVDFIIRDIQDMDAVFATRYVGASPITVPLEPVWLRKVIEVCLAVRNFILTQHRHPPLSHLVASRVLIS